jgi:hypothetical protein
MVVLLAGGNIYAAIMNAVKANAVKAARGGWPRRRSFREGSGSVSAAEPLP